MKCLYPLLLSLIFAASCNGQTQLSKDNGSELKMIPGLRRIDGSEPTRDLQISAFVRRILQDRNGDLWFGTNGDGVCRYDGKSLTYFSRREGFGGEAVRGIIEDESGNLWFATNHGVCRYDVNRSGHPCNTNSCKHDLQIPQGRKEHNLELARSFTTLTMTDGLAHDQVWSILKDRDGNFWFGTEGGVSRYNEVLKVFTTFPLPVPDIEHVPGAYRAPKLVNCIIQDKGSDLWFGTNGGGVYHYDGASLTNFSEKDGLCNNFVQCILEDKTGNLWFGTRFGGVSRYNGKDFTNFTSKDGLSHNFAWTMIEDKAGKIWLGTAGGGLFSCDGKSFTHYPQKDGIGTHVQSILEDRNGTLWLGCSGGLFRLEEKSFVNVTKDGPWH